MANIYDIAKLAGVSIATVSRVINNRPGVSENTKRKILEIVKENKYVPNSVARSLSTNESKLIGIFFNNDLGEGLHNMFFQEVIFGMERRLGQEGYDYVYFSDQKWHETNKYDYLGKCKDRFVDGAILLGIRPNESMYNLLNSDLPVVLIDFDFATESTSYVMCDHESSSKKAIDYLYNLGHYKIGLIMGPKTINPVSDRFEGYKKAIKKYNLPYKNTWIIETFFDENSGYKAMNKILELDDRPTAICCQSDVLAIGALRAIKEAGLNVPGDFSLIGFDDIEISKYIKPALTTLRQQTYTIGEKSIELLLKMIHNPNDKIGPIKLETQLIERESCKRYKF